MHLFILYVILSCSQSCRIFLTGLELEHTSQLASFNTRHSQAERKFFGQVCIHVNYSVDPESKVKKPEKIETCLIIHVNHYQLIFAKKKYSDHLGTCQQDTILELQTSRQ